MTPKKPAHAGNMGLAQYGLLKKFSPVYFWSATE